MIIVFIGTDLVAKNKKIDVYKKDFSKKGFSFERVSYKDVESPEDILISHIKGEALFEIKKVLILEGFLDKDHILKFLEENKNSDKTIFFVEEKIDKDAEKVITKIGGEVLDFSKKKEEWKKDYSLTNALISRDRKNLWLLFLKTLKGGESAEAIHGLLWWQMKNISMVYFEKKQNEFNLKPFQYSILKKSTSLFEKDELKKIIKDWVSLPDYSRSRNIPLSETMERFILERI
ncbi:hypothetical protein KC842_01830 [Candidatus Nomurabacteria bacterium]|nr:hypothetical protein [Candidatus Nomurabacteria bacterium]USN94650.1 MAG: hypothetical protein H6791_02750 [Candidatus Nomurabacteria bacterium]